MTRKELNDAFEVAQVQKLVSEKAFSIVVPALADNRLTVVQESERAKDVWDKRSQIYSEKTIIKKLTVLRNLLNMKHMRARNIGDHISILESQYARLEAMQTSLNDSTNVAVLVTTLLNIPDFKLLLTSISVLSEKDTTRSQV